MRLGYLVSQYPAPSHTFIQREVEALERRGLIVHTFSVRPPDASTEGDAPATRAARRTWSILPVDPIGVGRAHLWALRRRPRRYVQTLVAALRHRVPGAKGFVWSLFHFVEALVLAHELDRRNVEHLHNHFANAGANVGYLATRYLGLGWSLTLHGISEFDYPSGPLLPAKIEAARFVACASSFGRAQAMRVVDPSLWKKLLLVRCGIHVGATPPPRQERGGGPVRFLHVGRLAPEKGQRGLLDAMAGAVARGADVRLRIGGEGPLRPELEAVMEARGLTPYVTLLGRLDEDQVRAEMAQADAFVLSSLMEGLPVVLMEAMAMGLPVVAPRVAGIPELVEEGRSGILFDPSDWEGLCAGLCALAWDETLRHRLGRAGHARVAREYQIDRVVEPLLEELARWVPRASLVPIDRRGRSRAASAPERLDGAHAVREASELSWHADNHESDARVTAEARGGGG